MVYAEYVQEKKTVLLPTIYGYTLIGHLNAPYDGTNVEIVTTLRIATQPAEVKISKKEVMDKESSRD